MALKKGNGELGLREKAAVRGSAITGVLVLTWHGAGASAKVGTVDSIP